MTGAATARVTSGRSSLGRLLADLVANRGLVAVFAQRTISSRYKQTFLGLGWAVVQPVVALVVFTLFFGRLAGIDPGGGTYAAFALSALVPWQLFAAVVSEGSAALASEASLIRKVAVCNLAIVVGKSGSALVPLGVGLALLAGLGPVVGGRLSPHLLWIPLLVILVALPALALGLALGAVAVWTRDVNFGLPFALQALLFASPVAFPVVNLTAGWRQLYALVNPLVGPLEGMRRVYALGRAPDLGLLACSAGTTLVLALVCLEIYRRLEPGFADVV